MISRYCDILQLLLEIGTRENEAVWVIRIMGELSAVLCAPGGSVLARELCKEHRRRAEEVCKQHEPSSPAVVKEMANYLLQLKGSGRLQAMLDLMSDVHTVAGDVRGEEQGTTVAFKFVTERSAPPLTLLVVARVESDLSQCEWALSELRTLGSLFKRMAAAAEEEDHGAEEHGDSSSSSSSTTTAFRSVLR
mmetsp:Transcript_27492/g.54027  ORF Transcript_27492/g.54027 Transcript_27492/m.54027 type:complete len:192 (+) Transcript_27492:390-965(+)